MTRILHLHNIFFTPMNEPEHALPIVPFGKYKDKSVLELLADTKYVEWLKQQAWFANQKQIYNIVVHQTISATNNSNTPEHNRMQNCFLDTKNQSKLMFQFFKHWITRINQLLKDEAFVRWFGKHDEINISTIDADKLSVKFEEKFNWDVVLHSNGDFTCSFNSILEAELAAKETHKQTYKQKYDADEISKHEHHMTLVNQLMERRTTIDQKLHKIFKSRSIKMEHIVATCRELIKECCNYNENLWLTCCDSASELPSVEKLKEYRDAYVDDYRNTYETKFNEHYDEHYADHRMKFYSSMLSECGFDTRASGISIYKNKHTYQIKISIMCWATRGHSSGKLYCELKPTLSDDYPVVLRKMKTQIELMESHKIELRRDTKVQYLSSSMFHCYVLVVGTFTSVCVSKEQLVEIFRQSNIRVVFMEDMVAGELPAKPVVEQLVVAQQPNAEQLTNQLAQKLAAAEEKIRQLEEEINTLKSKKQGKSIKDYYGNKTT